MSTTAVTHLLQEPEVICLVLLQLLHSALVGEELNDRLCVLLQLLQLRHHLPMGGLAVSVLLPTALKGFTLI